ncbi:AAA family ATPase [Streptomyces sp. NPDC054770]
MGGTDHDSAGAPAAADTGVLVGREAELRIIGRLLAAEGGGALVVAGEPGIGRTSLLAAARLQAGQAGFTVVRVAGSESAAEVSSHGLHRLLVRLLDRASRLPAAQYRALMTALGLRQGSAPQPFLVALAALGVLVETAAQAPVLVCVDDLQWLDQPSADALAFVARRLGYDPIVLLATSRTHTGERPVPADLPRVDLGPLSAADASELVRRARADSPRPPATASSPRPRATRSPSWSCRRAGRPTRGPLLRSRPTRRPPCRSRGSTVTGSPSPPGWSRPSSGGCATCRGPPATWFWWPRRTRATGSPKSSPSPRY